MQLNLVSFYVSPIKSHEQFRLDALKKKIGTKDE